MRTTTSLLLSVLVALGCGDDGKGGQAGAGPGGQGGGGAGAPGGAGSPAPDAAVPDAAPRPDAPPAPPDAAPDGQAALIVSAVAIESRTGAELGSEGFDLDNDGDADNALAPLAVLANSMLAGNLTSGRLVLLMDVLDYAPPDDAMARLVAWGGLDADADPANNLGGLGRFYISSASVDAGGEARAQLAVGITGGRLRGSSTGRLDFGAGIVVERPLIGGAYPAPAGPLTDGMLAGALALCTAHRFTIGEGTSAVTLLELLATPPSMGDPGLQADLDLDGDGLERVEVESGHVVRCVDGAGRVILAPDCACDPAIADGYSMHMTFATVPAELVGTRAPPDGGT